MWPKLLLIAGALVNTGGPVRTGYSEFVPEDPLPKLLPEDTGESPAGDEAPVTPLLQPKAPVTPEPLVITGGLKSN